MTANPLDWLTRIHGNGAWVLVYAVVAVPLAIGLIRGRAPDAKIAFFPVLALPVTGLAVLFVSMLRSSLLSWAPNLLTVRELRAHRSGDADAVRLPRRSRGLPSEIRPHPQARHPHRRRHAPASKRRRRRRARAGQRAHTALTLAGIPIPAMDETKHFKMVGTTGTGKSTAIRELLEGALARGDRAVIADPDGGYLNRFYDRERGDVILNPFDPRAHTWNIYGELTATHDVEQLARSLIPDHDGADKSWRGYARTFFTAVARQTNDAGIRDLSELYRLLTCASTDELRILTAGTPAQPFLESGNERMFGSIRSVTGASLTALDYLAEQTGPPISVRDWVRTGRGVLFLPYQADQIAALRSIISAWLRLAIFQTMTGGEGDQRLWFIVDELDALGPIDGLEDALARLRKFGGRCVLGFQSIAQVSSTYGHGEAQTIVENCSNTLILAARPARTAAPRRFASQADRRTRSDPPDGLTHPQGWLLRRTWPQREPRRTARHRDRCASRRN